MLELALLQKGRRERYDGALESQTQDAPTWDLRNAHIFFSIKKV